MTDNARILKDFINFSQKNAELFTDEISASIANILPNLPDDIDQIAEEILKWCEQYPQIYDAFNKLPLSGIERGPGGSKTELTAKQIKTELNNRFSKSK